MQRMIYLAYPYTHPDSEIRRRRFEGATSAAATLISGGHIVYSPITMTHPIDIVLAGAGNTLGSDYWVRFDEAFMNACSEMVVVDTPGWKESKGIQREIDYFRSHGKPVAVVKPHELASYKVAVRSQ